MRSQLSKAIELASRVFIDKVDKAGKPYILHCLRVMNSVDQNDEELMCIAVLHDVPEDCPDIKFDDLRAMGFSPRVVDAVRLLTHDKNFSYDEYIQQVALNQDARKVKLADLRDNSDITRLKGLRKKDFDRMQKYHRAFVYLSN